MNPNQYPNNPNQNQQYNQQNPMQNQQYPPQQGQDQYQQQQMYPQQQQFEQYPQQQQYQQQQFPQQQQYQQQNFNQGQQNMQSDQFQQNYNQGQQNMQSDQFQQNYNQGYQQQNPPNPLMDQPFQNNMYQPQQQDPMNYQNSQQEQTHEGGHKEKKDKKYKEGKDHKEKKDKKDKEGKDKKDKHDKHDKYDKHEHAQQNQQYQHHDQHAQQNQYRHHNQHGQNDQYKPAQQKQQNQRQDYWKQLENNQQQQQQYQPQQQQHNYQPQQQHKEVVNVQEQQNIANHLIGMNLNDNNKQQNQPQKIEQKNPQIQQQQHQQQQQQQHQQQQQQQHYNVYIKDQNVYKDESSNSKWSNLLRQCEQNNSKFSDPDFPHNDQTLYESTTKNKHFGEILWLRPQEIFKSEKYEIFYQDIDVDDILQSHLGDCYLLSSIAALAEGTSSRIEKFFLSKKKNQFGCYALSMVWNGVKQEVILDDYLPCSKQSKQPFSLKTNGPEMWVNMIEKAWAKLHGNYERIEGQLSREALHDLTGAPARSFFTNRKQAELWKIILDGTAKKYIMCCGTYGEEQVSENAMKQVGLVNGHAYTLLSAHEEKLDGKIEQICKVRNPWGHFEWQGRLNENQSVWNRANQSVKDRVDFEKKDDGTFFINYNDLITRFDSIQICAYQDHFVYSSIAGMYSFQLSQKSIRAFSKDYQHKRDHYSQSIFIVHKIGDKYPTVAVKAARRDLTSFKYQDNPVVVHSGDYVAYVRVNWKKSNSDLTGFGVYGPSELAISKINPDETFIQSIVKYMDNEVYGHNMNMDFLDHRIETEYVPSEG